jgi:hypothetical protein
MLSFSNALLQQVHENIRWGQASNLQMVPTDCDQRDERYGWTGDAAITADEAAQNFDLGAFYSNWLRMLDDSSQKGAVPCWVPGGPGAGRGGGLGCDATWSSAFPSVAFALYHWNGDITAPRKHWAGLTRFIDKEYHTTGNGTMVENIQATWGDWQPAPGSPLNPDFTPEPRADKHFVGGFSFATDVGHMMEMATAIDSESVAKYTAMYAQVKKNWHKKWFDTKHQWYQDGGQTAQVLALALDRNLPHMMSPTEKASVLKRLVSLINGAGNHSTSGIIGFRYAPEVLSENGYGELALSLMTQTDYPSFGYQILNRYEPATTIWELWDSDTHVNLAHPMDSRNHIMVSELHKRECAASHAHMRALHQFGAVGSWLHTYVGGITNAPGSIGYQHVRFAPPAALIADSVARAPADYSSNIGATDGSRSAMATTAADPLRWGGATKETGRGTFGLFWSLLTPPLNQSRTCAYGDEGNSSTVDCAGASINEITFADYGTPAGDCKQGLRKGNCTTANLAQLVSALCIGQEKCTLDCTARVSSRSFMGCNITASASTGSGVRQKSVPLPDPCHGERKRIGIEAKCSSVPTLSIRTTAPANSEATTVVPLLGSDPGAVTVAENGTVLWRNGQYVPGVVGVHAAVLLDGAVAVRHGSGAYDFRRAG